MHAMRLICGGEGGGWLPCRTRLWREQKEEDEEEELRLRGAREERIADELCWVDGEVLLLLQRRRRRRRRLKICCCPA